MTIIARPKVARIGVLDRLCGLWVSLHTEWRTDVDVIGPGLYRVTRSRWEFGRLVEQRTYNETIRDIDHRLGCGEDWRRYCEEALAADLGVS